MSQITKRALARSLKKLLRQRALNKITISDITNDCGINRMTFYYHFKDIYDLVEWMCLEDGRKALEEKNSYETWEQGFLQIFELVRENKTWVLNIYRCVHQEQVERYVKPIVDRLVLQIIEEEAGTICIREEDKAFLARIYSYVLIGVMLDWIKEDMQAEPKQIVERLGVLMKGTITKAITRFQQ